MFLKAKFYFAQPYATSRVPIYILSKPEWPNMTELAFSVEVVSLEKNGFLTASFSFLADKVFKGEWEKK